MFLFLAVQNDKRPIDLNTDPLMAALTVFLNFL